MTLHADASPSSSDIWLRCPASVTKARGKKRLPTVYTAEGTAAHYLAELLIVGLPPPETIEIDGFVFDVDDDMIDAVERYAGFVETLKKKSDVFLTETLLDIPTIGGERIYGTADVIAYTAKTQTLDVVDLKYGKGVTVSAKSNSQLRIYALGAIYKLSAEKWMPVRTIRMTIIQPRTESDLGVNTEEIDIHELTAWQDTVLAIAIEKLSRNDQTENPGAHCRWCVRAGECGSLAKMAQTEARIVFDKKTNQMHPEVLSDKDLAGILDSVEMITSWIDKVRLEASQRLDHGAVIPGWKLVAKRAMEKWIDDKEALAEMEISYPDCVDQMVKLRTPAQVKKVIVSAEGVKPGIAAAIVEELTVKESSGNTLARDDDARPKVETSPKTVFNMLKTSLELPEQKF